MATLAPGHGRPCPPDGEGTCPRVPTRPPTRAPWKRTPTSRRRPFRDYAPFITALLATILTLSLVVFPKDAFGAAVDGMHVFWNIVFPSLLPFFVLSDILLGLGVVHFLGVLLEPLMRPLFNVPGVGAFALSMGLAAGYPMDAVITARFRRMGLCTRVEGERLLAFTNTADPLFLLGAVAVGMFASPRLGVVLAAAHYLSSFAVGLVFRFYGRREQNSTVAVAAGAGSIALMRRAAKELLKARREDGRTFGKLLGESVQESIKTLLMICGFIMLFSVVVRVATVVGLTAALSPALGGVLRAVGLHPSLTDATFRGLLEIDLGTIASAKAAAPMLDRVVIASFIIAWSGLSVHAQVASVVVDSDIRMSVYVVARVIQAAFAGLFAWLLMGPLGGLLGWTATVMLPVNGVAIGAFSMSSLVVQRWIFGVVGVTLFAGTLTVASLGLAGGRAIRTLARRALR